MRRFVFIPLLLVATLTLLFAFLAWGQKSQPAGLPEYLSIPSKKIDLSGLNVHYVEAGKGPPLLFLHGLGGSWKDWSATLPAFAASYQVMAVDFPGFGDSDQPEVKYSIEWLTEVVEKFIQERRLDGVNLVGHSMGGLVALNLAARPNSRVKRLIIIDAVGIGDKSEFISYVMTKKIMGPETRWESFEGFLKDEFRGMADSFIKDQKPKTARDFFESVPKNPITGSRFLPMTPHVQMAASIIDFDIRPQLASVRQPTLILWGTKDPVAPPQDASFLNKEIRQSKLVLFPDSGHSPMIEHPSLFNQELGKFLQTGESVTSK
jgi:pimeloyl-ACP methyl ester carboxylesterase